MGQVRRFGDLRRVEGEKGYIAKLIDLNDRFE